MLSLQTAWTNPRSGFGPAVRDTVFDNTPYISCNLLERLFQSTANPVPDRQKLIIPGTTGEPWYLTVDNPFILIGNRPFNLIYPVRRGPNYLYLPLKPLEKLLLREYGIRLSDDFKITNKKPVAKGAGILAIRKIDKDNGAIIRISLSGRLDFKTHWVFPYYLVTFPGARVPPDLPKKLSWKGLIRSVSTLQEDSTAQITLYLPFPIDTIETNWSEPGNILNILVRKPQKNLTVYKPLKKKRKSKKTIILDPGHGGRDPGCVFKDIQEKRITLKVANQLKKILKKKGYSVKMTRTKDIYVPLANRPKFAAANGGDLFISLHCNAIAGTPKRLKQIQGHISYILRAGESEEDKALARRENQAIRETRQKKSKAEITPVEWILLEHELNLYSHQSEKLAESIVRAFKKAKIPKHRTGASQAGFFVLAGSFMPAVLFEMGFITNEKDRRYLASNKGKNDIAARLADAVVSFFQTQKI